jgi:MFS family permease
VALWAPTLPRGAGIAVFLALIAWRALGSGVVATPWQEMLAKLIPVTHRGRFFGVAHVAGQLLGVGGSALAALILAGWSYPHNFALSFAVGAAGIWLSLAFLALTREPAQPPAAGAAASQLDREYARRLWTILRGNANFRAYLASRWLSYLGGMAAGFLAVYAVERFALGDDAAAVFTGILFGAGVVGYGIWGGVGDRYGHKRVMVLAAALWLGALGVALLAADTWGFYAAFALMGLSSSAGTLSDLNLAMEFGPEAERPTYIGLTRTASGPALLIAPVLGGLLAQTWGYPVLLAVSSGFALAGGLWLALGVREPRQVAALQA